MRSRTFVALALAAATAGAGLTLEARADAFCGFYVSGADAKLFNNATLVVMMREGQRTVLAMQNAYEGPPENFAMVVPVPIVLQKENVKTLPRDIFDKVDKLTSPRLVEYWEQDPCAHDSFGDEMKRPMAAAKAGGGFGRGAEENRHGVTIEAQFTVGEYEVVILSAKDSTGLYAWLKENKYKVPDGAEPLLAPYVQAGSKFFVAKVDVTKVTMANGQAVLSPLRFHYDSDRFELPVRLGLVNSSGTQDLVVNILARHQRYEVANYPNVTIPTNLDVADPAKEKFASFYTALYDKTLERSPRAVVTEYAWDAGSCDPCPTPGLTPQELATLGEDVLTTPATPAPAPATVPVPAPPTLPGAPRPGAGGAAGGPGLTPMGGRSRWFGGRGFVVTRLHARYKKDAVGEDLVFRAAPPIQGGREWRGPSNALEKGATPGGINNFQARYAIRHPWAGAMACDHPVRGRWGGPPGSSPFGSGGRPPPQPAARVQFAPRGGVELAAFVKEDVPEIGLMALAVPPNAAQTEPAKNAPSANATPPQTSSCGGCSMTSAGAGAGATLGFGALGVAAMFALRRRRS